MSKSRKGISLPDLSILFGPDPDGQETKNGASAEAARREDVAMNDMPKFASAVKIFGLGSRVEDIVEGSCVFDPAFAQQIIASHTFPGQDRHLTDSGKQHVAVLAHMMKHGNWREKDHLDFVWILGRIYLLNGHHRVCAQVLSQKSVLWSVTIHACSSPAEAKQIYYTYDTNVRGRTNQNILKILDAAKTLDVSKVSAEALYRAAPLLASNFNFVRSSAEDAYQRAIVNRVVDERMSVMTSYKEAVGKWEKAIKKAPAKIKRSLCNQGAMAVAMTAFRYSSEKAVTFWTGLSENDGLRVGDARRTYLEALHGTSPPSAFHTAQQAAIAWNAWYEDRPLKILKVYPGRKLEIAGTMVGR